MLRRSGGQRQRIWNALLRAKGSISTNEIVEESGGLASSVRGYLSGLAKHGYVERAPDGWRMIRRTGDLAPGFSVQTGELRDWNTDPAMPAADLEAIWQRHGGTLAGFAGDIGLSPTVAGRLSQMMRGQRPVTTNVETAARAWMKKKSI